MRSARHSMAVLDCSRRIGMVAATLVASASALGASAPESQAGRELLARTVSAYRAAPALRDSFRASVTSGDSVSALTMHYVLGAGTNVELRTADLEVTALDGRVLVLRNGVGDKYLEAPLEGTLDQTLTRLVGDLYTPVPPVSMRLAPSDEQALESALEHLGLNLLGRLEVAGTRMVSSDRGRELHRLELEAELGRVELDIRPDTFLLTAMRIERAASDSRREILVEGRFEPELLDSAEGIVAFDPESRKRVESLDELIQTRMETGEAAPSLAVSRLGGGVIALPQMRGRVLVLDFFSSGCADCAQGLAETQRLASWAQAEGLEAVFLAVNTFEEVDNDRQARAIAAEYLNIHRLTLPTLLDWNHELAITLGVPGVPTLYLIAPNGRIAGFYDGVARPGVEELEDLLLELAGDSGTAGDAEKPPAQERSIRRQQ